MISCRSPAWCCVFCSPSAKRKKKCYQCCYTHTHTHTYMKTHCKSIPTCLQLCSPLTVCVSKYVCGPSGPVLALRLKQCQQVCDETSQMIPRSFPFRLSLSRCLSSVQSIIQPPLSVSCPLFFLIIYLSVRLILTPCGRCYFSLHPTPLLFLSEYVLQHDVYSFPLPLLRSLSPSIILLLSCPTLWCSSSVPEWTLLMTVAFCIFSGYTFFIYRPYTHVVQIGKVK